MATLKITKKTTVANLKKQFNIEVGACELRVYNGRSEANDDDTLVSLGANEGGKIEFRTSRTVGAFEDAMLKDLNLKVKVFTKDNWVKVLDGITLAAATKLPNGMTKAKMEEFLSYKRTETEDEARTDDDSEEMEIPKEFKGITSFVDIANLKQFPWAETSEDELEEMCDELDVPGVVIAYAEDEDGDFESFACVGGIYDIFVDNLPDWANEWWGERKFKVFISTDIKFHGDITKLHEDEDENKDRQYEVVECGLMDFVGAGTYPDLWWLGKKCLFRVNWPERNRNNLFTILKNGSFDMTWEYDEKLTNYIIKKIDAGENK
jgi:hypothetical protein